MTRELDARTVEAVRDRLRVARGWVCVGGDVERQGWEQAFDKMLDALQALATAPKHDAAGVDALRLRNALGRCAQQFRIDGHVEMAEQAELLAAAPAAQGDASCGRCDGAGMAHPMLPADDPANEMCPVCRGNGATLAAQDATPRPASDEANLPERLPDDVVTGVCEVWNMHAPDLQRIYALIRERLLAGKPARDDARDRGRWLAC